MGEHHERSAASPLLTIPMTTSAWAEKRARRQWRWTVAIPSGKTAQNTHIVKRSRHHLDVGYRGFPRITEFHYYTPLCIPKTIARQLVTLTFQKYNSLTLGFRVSIRFFCDLPPQAKKSHDSHHREPRIPYICFAGYR